MNVAAGLYAPDAGSIIINGVATSLKGPADARARGIGMVHQHFKLVKPFTIAENILLANRRPHFSSGISDICAAIRKQADELKFDMDPNRPVGTLTVAEQQQVEIVKVLVGGAKILILFLAHGGIVLTATPSYSLALSRPAFPARPRESARREKP